MTRQGFNPTSLIIRADGGPDKGYGRLMRMKAIADEIEHLSTVPITFITRNDSDLEFIRKNGFNLVSTEPGRLADELLQVNLPQSSVLIDSEHLTESDLTALHEKGYRVILMNSGFEPGQDEAALVIDYMGDPENEDRNGRDDITFLQGADYVPLRSKFKTVKPAKIAEKASKITVTFGGADPHDLTILVYELLERMELKAEIRIILGPGYEGEVNPSMQNDTFKIFENPDNIEEILADSDLVISSAGLTSYELSYLGRPMILFGLTPAQELTLQSIADKDAALNSGSYGVLDSVVFKEQVLSLLNESSSRKQMSDAGKRFIDGNGASRIAEKITEMWN